MKLGKQIEWTVNGWTIELSLSSKWLAVGVSWETGPFQFTLGLPFITLSVESSNEGGEPWQWNGSLARLIIWRTEFRLDLDPNIWLIGVMIGSLDDFGVYLGPINLQVETDKGFNEAFPPGVPTLRLLFPPGYSLRPWPPRCRCCPPRDRLQCDDVTDFAAIHNRGLMREPPVIADCPQESRNGDIPLTGAESNR
jgi:hypothetical protein